jgi:drug/metabolite transporter (DMT)-like permease
MLGLVIGFLGIVFLVIAENAPTQEKVSLTGMLAIIFCAAAWAIGSVMLSQQSSRTSSTRTTATQMLAGGSLLLIVATLAGEWSATNWELVSIKSLIALLFLIVGTLIAFSAYSWLMRSVPVTMASTYAYVNPVIAVVLGWALAGEHLTVHMLLASVIIISSVVLIIAQRKPNN